MELPALEIGTSKIICMFGAEPGKGRNLPVSAVVSYEGIKNGSFVERSRVEAAIRSAVENAEIAASRQVSEIICGVPGCFLKLQMQKLSIEIPGESVTKTDLEELKGCIRPTDYTDAVHIGTRYAYYMDDSGEVYISEPFGIKTRELSACAVLSYASLEYIDTVEAALEKLQIKAAQFVGEGFAQAMHFIPSEERDKSAILIDMGASQTSVSAVYADAVLKEESIFMGSSDLTGDLAIAIDTDMQTAQNVRKNYIFGIDEDSGDVIYGKDEFGRMVGFDVIKVRSTIEKRMRMILSEVMRVIDGMSDVLFPRADVYFTGGDCQIRGITQFMSSVLEKQVYSVWKSSNMLPCEYNTSLALLDNAAYSLYDLKKETSEKKSLNEKILGLFR